jgi:hypothetical protein
MHNVNDKSNWCRIKSEYEDIIQQLLKDLGGDWQIPIYAPKGSFIIWLSSVIHSAKYQDHREENDEKDKWKGWRGVVYVSYRPKSEFTNLQIKKRKKIIDDNRVMNHWGTKMFPKHVGGRWVKLESYHPKIQEYIKDPKKVYSHVGYPKLTEKQMIYV